MYRSLLTALALIGTTTAPALAIPFGTNSIYRVGSGTVYFSAPAGSTITLKVPGTATTKLLTPNAQGYAILKPPTGKLFSPLAPIIKVNGADVNFTSLPVGTIPATTGPSPTENFQTAAGEVVLANLTGPTTVVYSIPKDKTLTVNACGFTKLGSTTSPAPSNFSYQSVDNVTSALPDAQNPPICKKDSLTGISTGYKPVTAGW
jgi:hypothetical protein